MEKATFAAGCFWHVEAAFREVKGVTSVQSGYTGGDYEDPSYEDVHSGSTGHAEAVEVEFDPGQVSYEKLLDVFWRIHNPTQVNRQGPDVGEQYRSAIFYHTTEQKDKATASRDALQNSPKYKGKRIATQIVPAKKFWRAEEYHQRYLEKHGVASCGLP